MKRLFTILLAVLSLLSLTACGGSPTEETSQEPLVDIQPQEPEAPPEPTPGGTGRPGGGGPACLPDPGGKGRPAVLCPGTRHRRGLRREHLSSGAATSSSAGIRPTKLPTL